MKREVSDAAEPPFLKQLGDDIWVADGPTAIDLLIIPYTTRMTVVRLRDGGLWVASPVKCSATQLDEIRELGPIRHLVSPTPRHRWRLEPWHTLFPDASLWSCALSISTLGGRSLHTTRLGDNPPPEWEDELGQAVYHGRGFQELTFLHRSSKTLLIDDVFQSHDHHPGKPVVNALIRIGGLLHPGGAPGDIRAITKRASTKLWAEKVLSWDFERIVLAHGPVIEHDAKAHFSRAFAWLLA